MIGKWKCYVDRTNFGRRYDIALYRETVTGEMVMLGPPAEVAVQENDSARPTLSLGPSDAQSLLDHLWAVGLRPTNGEGNEGQLGATQRHLDDMRKIAFGFIDARKPILVEGE